MDEAEIEGVAVAAYNSAGLDYDEPRVLELARRLVGPVMTAHGISLPGDACLDDGRILVRPKAVGWRRRWAVAHEIAEWLLLREGVRSEWQESIADRLAASLLSPLPRARRVCRCFRGSFEGLADDLAVHPFSAVLRFGEVTRSPTQLHAKGGVVRARGDEWPAGAAGDERHVLGRTVRWVS
jgi:hypothetical protein